MIEIKVNVADGVSAVLASIISALTTPEMAELNEVGGRAASEAARKFSQEFDRAGGWRTSAYRTSSGPSRFGADVAAGWHFLTADPSGAVIYNDADHYAFRVRGGTIRPKRVSRLTIPLVPEARGLRVATYVQNTGRRLFTIPGRNALFERVDRDGTTGERVISRTRGRHRDGSVEMIRRKGGIRAVYALLASVTLPPMPEAAPPDELLIVSFSTAWRNELADRIERITS
ncbi:hypothetical protein OKA04_12855 [Luteolibacter flavescens]|uniref:Uncharacterized protein n=1 Tax=Luteolibacter flavescens TaxID=1859460 RepID=A0ABT3FQW1_9BACT|nr:hypothetical protein [Luteolibacter flavescens]MCW1885621.1 hypothetical protein [Luteolibacter flavescens]